MKPLLPLLALTIFSFAACNDYRQKVNYVIGKRVSLEYLNQLKVATDSIQFIPGNSPADGATLKLCYYVDSTKCFGCQLKWIENLRPYYELEDRFNGAFSVCLIVSPTVQSKNEVKFFLKSLFSSGETIYLDKKHEFYSQNKFLLKDEQFNMFLLDKDNRVICIGNSLAGNKELEKLTSGQINLAG